MLRISIHDESGSLTLRLAGKLAGPWVKELDKCWQATRDNSDKLVIRIDLSEVIFVDAEGRNLLAAMHTQGVKFKCAGCLMKSVVAEITRTPACRASDSGYEAK